jgi:predicted nucleic acid-binding protein
MLVRHLQYASGWLSCRHGHRGACHRTASQLRTESLGRGESEAISLPMELNATVLLDDKRGRIEAAARHVETAGTLAVLLQGALKGKVDLRDSIDRLKSLGFRIAQEIEDGIFERYRRLSNRT